MGESGRRHGISSLSAAPTEGTDDSLMRLVAAGPSRDGAESIGIPHPGEIIDGKYHLQRLIGRGGMGWVFEALHLQTDKTVALKYLRADLAQSKAWIERFAREARLAGKIDHPNVVRVYDLGGIGAGTYIVMELLRGQTLRERLRTGAMRYDEALPLLLAVMRGVAEAHRLGIVHRDLKPDNIFLCTLPDGQPDVPKVLDFGVSKIVERMEPLRADTPLAYAGTAPYMPLEQLRGDAVDARSDVYALGVVLFEALTGSHPFQGRTREELAHRASTQPTPRLPSWVHPDVDRFNAVLARALAREPAERYPNVRIFAAALESLCVDASAPEPAGRSARRWLVPVALVLAGLLVLAATRLNASPADAIGSGSSSATAARVPAPSAGPALQASRLRDEAQPSGNATEHAAGPTGTAGMRTTAPQTGPRRRPAERPASERPTASAPKPATHERALQLLPEDF